jgi:predicted phosphate transport protein (TIGR00153 family)
MNLSNLLSYFTPKEKKFYAMFNEAAICCIDASVELNNLFTSTTADELKSTRLKIKAIEKRGDDVATQVFDALNNTFITPFDREDIHQLANTLDDVVDLMYSVSGKVEFYRLTVFSAYMKDMVAEIQRGCVQIQTAVNGLDNFKNNDKTLRACKDLNKLETRVDKFFYLGISSLFDNEKDAIELIKQKDILLNIEKIANKMEDVSDVVKTILVKYA